MQVIWAQLNFTEILINFFGVVTPRIKKLKLDAIWFMPNVSFVVHGDTFFYLVDVVVVGRSMKFMFIQKYWLG